MRLPRLFLCLLILLLQVMWGLGASERVLGNIFKTRTYRHRSAGNGKGTKGYTTTATTSMANGDDDFEELPMLVLATATSGSSEGSRSKGKGKGKGKGGGKGNSMGMASDHEPMLVLKSTKRSKSKGGSRSSQSRYKSSKSSRKHSRSRSYFMEMMEATASPTIMPTLNPTLTPTIAPTVLVDLDAPAISSRQCKADNQQGTFGSLRGDPTVTMYIYQVETQPEISRLQFQTEIIPQIELAMANEMIPFLFGQLCGLFQRRELQQYRNSAYLGINVKPTDQVLDVDCSGSFFQRPCYVVSGLMTMYTVGKTSEKVQAETVWVVKNLDEDLIATTVPGVNKMVIRGSPAVLLPQTSSPTTPIVVTVPDVTPQPTVAMTALPTAAATNTPTLADSFITTTIIPSQDTPPLEVEEPKAGDDEGGGGGGLEWWRWLIFSIILVLALAAIFYVYKRCDNKPQAQVGGHETFDVDDDGF